jgi:hypothetical protein
MGNVIKSENVIMQGIGKDAEIEINTNGGKQSKLSASFVLLDAKAMFRLGKILKEGAQKYERDNWRKIDTESHIDHALNHIFAYLAGDKQDDHLGHAFCRLMFACATEEKENENM